MIKRFTAAFLFALCFILSSCADNTVITKYDSGEKYEEYQYTGDSLKHGAYKRYSPGGVLMEESNYVDGQLEGERKIYTESGKPDVTEIYSHNALNGPFKTFYPNGKVKMEAVYTNNVLSGIVKGFYDTGELKEEVLFEDNVEEGPFKEFHKNGKVKWEGTYRNGANELGLLQEYNESGELIRKMMCDDRSICTTTWTLDGSHLKTKES